MSNLEKDIIVKAPKTVVVDFIFEPITPDTETMEREIDENLKLLREGRDEGANCNIE